MTIEEIKELYEKDCWEFVPDRVFEALLESDKISEEILDQINDWNEKQLAVFEYFDFNPDLINKISETVFIDGYDAAYTYYDIDDKEIRVLDDIEADEALEGYVEEVIEDELGTSWLKNYIDKDKLIDDMHSERGLNLAGYDGKEFESTVTSESIYIYRNN